MTKTIDQTTKPAASLIVSIMPKAALHAIAVKGINADAAYAIAAKKHGATYAACATELRAGIASGLTSTQAFAEYRRRVNEFCAEIAKARMADYDGEDKAESIARHVANINKGIDRDNKKAAWVSPKAEKSADEVAVVARKREADKKASQRAVKKLVATLKKQKPKTDEGELEAEAKAQVAAATKEQREAAKDSARYVANESRYLERLAAFNAEMGEVFQADVREMQKRLAAVILELQAVRTKA